MELGLHTQNFTSPEGPAQIGPTLSRIARTAEDAGVTRLTVMDHVWQIGVIGPPEHDMVEAYTTLGFLAASTRTALLHTLVTGAVYRDPGDAGEDGDDAGRAVGRPRGAGDRGGLERR